MAAFEHFENMYDVRLKPRLLRSLIKDHLPDEKHPFSSPSELSNVVSTIKTHGLLSESFEESVDRKQIDKWKSTVDAWVERLLLLASSKMPPSDSHFVKVASCASLSDLFTRLGRYSNVKKDGTSHAGKLVQPVLKLLAEDSSEAVWEGAVDLLYTVITFFPSSVHRHCDNSLNPDEKKRLLLSQCMLLLQLADDEEDGVMLGVGEDATVEHGGSLLLMESRDGEILREREHLRGREGELMLRLSVAEVSVELRALGGERVLAEAVIVSKIMSGKCSTNMLKKLAHCLALLPKSRGDEDSWSLMMQKIQISINALLNDAFQGLEEETIRNECFRLLVPPGKDHPPPLGGQTVLGEASYQAIKRSEQLLIPRVSTLMICCCAMLTSPYPVQVTVPVHSLLALVRRVLRVDGSLSQALLPFMTVMQQELNCSELPVLHLYSLDLLTAIIKGVRSQLLPHAADIVRLLTDYFRRCTLPALRIKVYSIIRILLISMGAGMALYLAQEVISNAFVDLDSHGSGGASSNAYSDVTTEALRQPSHRKRKHVTTTIGYPEEHQNGGGLEVAVPKNKPTTPISVKIAALQALEALLTVGGALRSECWRSNVDLLLVTVATNACDGGWVIEEKSTFALSDEPTSTRADFQLAALCALLASLLSPTRVRPPYLSQGLELFRRGKQETGTKLADFCAHALLALEVLIHPRALPLADFQSANHGTFNEGFSHSFSKNIFSGDHKHNTPFSRGILGMDDPDPDDDLYDSWLGNGEETETPVSIPEKQMKHGEEASEKDNCQAIGDPLVEKLPNKPADAQAPEKSNWGSTGGVNVEMGGSGDEIMVELEQLEEPICGGNVGTSDKSVMLFKNSLMGTELESSKGVAEHVVLDSTEGATISSSVLVQYEMASGKGVSASVGDVSALATDTSVTTFPAPGKGKGLMLESDAESSMDSFPDIVDGDPDSDY
ncbi:hypothetical protein HHK36_024749 [Tetracentron sinense]|uniref:Pre-rRNA-processing protein RIX1 N-terminal domain-containing protein n=1 Tax=Tetracentron sinense TaxID=13715 RepID=A0A834YJH7_TETSI|nr:hypothetical protein HHK36_024749 [Tetracentron sinense]